MANLRVQSVAASPTTINNGKIRINFSAERILTDTGDIIYRIIYESTRLVASTSAVTTVLRKYKINGNYRPILLSNETAGSSILDDSMSVLSRNQNSRTNVEYCRRTLRGAIASLPNYDSSVTVSVPSETISFHTGLTTTSISTFTATFPSFAVTVQRYNIPINYNIASDGPSESNVTYPTDNPIPGTHYGGDLLQDPGNAITSDVNFKFNGWFSDSSKVNKISFPYTIPRNKSITLYSGWKLNTPQKVQIKVNGMWQSGELKAKVNGAWVDAESAYVKVNGMWMEIDSEV